MRSRRPFFLGLVVAGALAVTAPALGDPPPAATTTDTGGIQVQTAQPVVQQVAGAHVVRRAGKRGGPAKGGRPVVRAAAGATLPFTGGRPGPVAALGLALLVAGALLRHAGRRSAVVPVSRP